MATSRQPDARRGDALDLLERQNRALLELFIQLDSSKGPGVQDRYDHGNQGKRLVRRLALREAAKGDIVRVLDQAPEFDALREHLIGKLEDRRTAINVLSRMGRGVRPIDLNKTQDLDGAIEVLRRIVEPEINWELSEGIAAIRNALSTEQRASLRSARYLWRHAPTKLDTSAFRRRERTRVLGRVLTAWDHLLGRPRPVKGARVD